MRRYEVRDEIVRHEVEAEAVCDDCGVAESDTEFGRLIPVAIEVNLDEEGGHRDEYDYCDRCLLARSALLAAAGSRAFIVTGEEPPS